MIAELPLFSGALFRSAFCIASLSLLAWYNCRYYVLLQSGQSRSSVPTISTAGLELGNELDQYRLRLEDWLALAAFSGLFGFLLYGVFAHDWYIDHFSAMFVMIAIAAAIIHRMPVNNAVEQMIAGAGAISGGTLAMIALARVPYDRWLRFIFPLVAMLFVLSWVFLAVATVIGLE
jgi:uncharacterized ion transporter superfamily protein YfcC